MFRSEDFTVVNACSERLYIPPAEKTSGLLARAMTCIIVNRTPGNVARPASQPEQYTASPMLRL